MKKVYAVLFLITFVFRLWQSTGCLNFISYKFDPLRIKINVEEQTLVDGATQTKTTRIFHNKISSGILEFGKSYTKVIEPNTIIEILGPLGLILLIGAISYTIKKPGVANISHLSAVVLTPLIVLLLSNQKLSYFLLSGVLFSYSLWGLKLIKNNRMSTAVLILFFIVNIWYFFFSWQMPQICNEIFFH